MNPIGIASSLIPQIFAMITAAKQRREAKAASQKAQQLLGSELGYANQGLTNAQQGLAQAQNDYNARTPSASYLEKNIFQNQSNTLNAVDKNATDASQALAMAGAVQGNTNNAFNQLQQQEAQNRLYQQQNVMGARQSLMGAQNNIQNIYGRQSDIAANTGLQLGQNAQQNTFNALQGLGNAGMMAGMGEFGNISFGKKQPGFSPGMMDNQMYGFHAQNPFNFSLYKPFGG